MSENFQFSFCHSCFSNFVVHSYHWHVCYYHRTTFHTIYPYISASKLYLTNLKKDKTEYIAPLIVTCLMFRVGVSCRILYSSVNYLYVSGSGSTTLVGEERANLSAVVYL